MARGLNSASSAAAQGHRDSERSLRKVAIRFEDDVFEAIDRFAYRQRISFAAAARILVRRGIRAEAQ